MKIETFVVGMVGTNCYLMINEETNEAVIFDPGAAPDYLISHIKSLQLTPKAIMLTHGHFDHIMGIDAFVEEFNIPVYVSELEKELIADPKLNMASDFRNDYSYGKAQYTKEGDVLDIAGFEFKVIETPGHTSGSCCYYVAKENVLFSGDTLFRRSIGRSDFPTGNEAVLKESIREKLLCLPDATIVYAGHNGITTIGEERIGNPLIFS